MYLVSNIKRSPTTIDPIKENEKKTNKIVLDVFSIFEGRW